ncbi:retrovirus-related pol polyprotein from transposon TNT 1-94 [Tanacetum coccineum]
MAAEVPQTLEYRGGQLNVAPLLEVENFTNWKKRFMCHIAGIEPQFKTIVANGPFVPMDFQDSLDDEDDTRSSQEYFNDLKEEYLERALLAKSKRFFKNGTQRFSSAKATDQTECHKCGKNGHFARDCWRTKDFESKDNKVKAKLALLSSSALASKASMLKNKGLIAEAYEWDEE